MSDAELLAPVTPQEQTPPPEPPTEEPQAAAPVGEDADLDKIIEEQAIDIPGDTDKLVPLAAVENARAKLKTVRAELETAKQGTARATELEGQLQQLQQQVNALKPYADAYQAALAAQPPAEPQGPTPEERAELEEIARDNDYYKTDGSLDLERATRQQARILKAAEKIAQQTIAPLQQQSTTERSAGMLHKAKLTALPDGSKPDPQILDWVWGQLDPKLTATREGAQQAFVAAVGYATSLNKLVKGTAAPAAPKEPLPPPLLTEKSGGRDHTGPTLTEADRRAARDLGLSDKEYAEELATMPQGWGRSR